MTRSETRNLLTKNKWTGDMKMENKFTKLQTCHGCSSKCQIIFEKGEDNKKGACETVTLFGLI